HAARRGGAHPGRAPGRRRPGTRAGPCRRGTGGALPPSRRMARRPECHQPAGDAAGPGHDRLRSRPPAPAGAVLARGQSGASAPVGAETGCGGRGRVRLRAASVDAAHAGVCARHGENGMSTVRWSLRFLGTGAAHAHELGNASAVLQRDDEPLLMIDCGPDALARYLDVYGEPPRALYITHLHMDHVGGLEELFQRAWFDEARCGRIHLYLHANLLPWMQARVADYPGVLAEGGVNFWEAFRLVPCSRGFWHAGYWFDVFG